jgi:multidrug efflux pump subunit AcrA (membrane-fusion protein)
MKTDYCAYPPQIAADVEIVEQRDGERTAFIVGSASAGRFIILRETERKVLNLIDESRPLREVCEEFKSQHGGNLAVPTLVKFLTKLDQAGILAGERSEAIAPPEQQLSQAIYVRFKLFNPERLFARFLPPLRWIWTTWFFVATVLMMVATFLLSLVHWAEVASYGGYVLSEHYVAVFVAGWVIVVTHEFAHGMTCKAFGGRVTEVGVLLIYYFLPGLYCNVSGIHLIPQRNQRLWVIAAGIYWQLMVGTVSLLGWFALAPYTLMADLAFIFFFGSVLNIVFNANPLIKLDGYYFLSQLLRLPNLMDRSRSYWRGLLKMLMFGDRNQEAAKYARGERAIYFAFGLLSFLYNVGLRCFIVIFIGGYLIEWFHLPGLFCAAAIAIFYARRPLRQMITSITSKASNLLSSKSEGIMAANDQTTTTSGSSNNPSENHKPRWRRRIVPAAIALLVVAVLVMPWSASVGNYGALIAIPNREVIVRAPESATLIELRAQPGQQLAAGAVIGRMDNLELEEQIVQAQSELARANADYDRLLGELRAHSETAARADLLLRQRRIDFDEINSERQQIERRRIAEASARAPQVIAASTAPPTASSAQSELTAPSYPAALAALQAEADSYRAQLAEANAHRDRMKQLHAQGITPRSELDAAETRAATLASILSAARERLEAALVEHRRKHKSTVTELNVAHSDLSAERLQIEKLSGELGAMRRIIASLEDRRELLRRKREQFELVTPRAGTVFGEDLPRLVGNYFQKGAEICRVADTGELLLRIQLPEREVGDVRVGHPVRLKARSFPDRVFRGVVSKIGGESEQDQYGQATYRVELTIENGEGMLRPGMTAFARIDFDRQMVGRILIYKIKRALRPELWML